MGHLDPVFSRGGTPDDGGLLSKSATVTAEGLREQGSPTFFLLS